MRKPLAAVMPVLVGLMLGWLLFHPPFWVSWLGAWKYLLWTLPGIGLLVCYVGALIVKNLEPGRIVPCTDASVDVFRPMVARFEQLGYGPAGPTLRVDVCPPAVLVPAVHSDGLMYATLFQTGTIPSKMGYDIVSVFEDGQGALTTGCRREGATLPIGPGAYMQIFPDAEPATLHREHLAALEELWNRGLRPREHRADRFLEDFRAAFARQREHFLKKPLQNTLIAIYRSLTGRSPHLGPIRDQLRR